MSSQFGSENGTRIALDDIITAVGQGRPAPADRPATGPTSSTGFYID